MRRRALDTLGFDLTEVAERSRMAFGVDGEGNINLDSVCA